MDLDLLEYEILFLVCHETRVQKLEYIIEKVNQNTKHLGESAEGKR